MIEVAVEPERLTRGQEGRVIVRLINRGSEPCTNVVLTLRIPGQLGLLHGSERIKIDKLEAGQTEAHPLILQPRREGVWPLASVGLSYSDAFGRSHRHPGARWDLTVLPAEASRATLPAEALRATSRPKVILDTTHLPLGRWEQLEGRVINDSDSILRRVSVKLRGRVDCDPCERTLGDLRSRGEVAWNLRVRALEPGSSVPLNIEVTFTDVNGLRSSFPEEASLAVLAREGVDVRDKPPQKKIKILFLASSPLNLPRLRVEQEFRGVGDELDRSESRGDFELHYSGAVRSLDITRAILNLRPSIVHISAHGSDGKVYIEDDCGQANSAALDALAAVFGMPGSVQCVIINACYSDTQAQTIAEHVGCAIGMHDSINDEAAVIFSRSFYLTLVAGYPYEKAYEVGCAHVRSQGLSGEPVFYQKDRPPKRCP